jgi:uncharacterized iron-regulated membrane protein
MELLEVRVVLVAALAPLVGELLLLELFLDWVVVELLVKEILVGKVLLVARNQEEEAAAVLEV